MGTDIFRFKQFVVNHGFSSMKVGVDAVILGAWAGKRRSFNVLDIGTGCGIISLILAQRQPKAFVHAVDIDKASVEEAKQNFKISPFANRMSVSLKIFPEDLLQEKRKYDLIVSNPPFFKSGIVSPSTSREIARHQDTLSPFSLISNSEKLLLPGGYLSMIFPMEFRDAVVSESQRHNFIVRRECRVRNNPKRPEKRVMIEFQLASDSGEIFAKGNSSCEEIETESLTLFIEGQSTEEYRTLCSDLYLKF